ncbi:hypothetical protein BCR36DRAFT_331910, partial [Piromyces finnis]
MSTIKKVIPAVMSIEKFSFNLKEKVRNSEILSDNSNIEIPPAAEFSIRSNYENSSSKLDNLKINSKDELKLNKNYKIKNSEFQIITDYPFENRKEIVSQGVKKKNFKEQNDKTMLSINHNSINNGNDNNNNNYHENHETKIIAETKETIIKDSHSSSKTEGLFNDIHIKLNQPNFYNISNSSNEKMISSNNKNKEIDNFITTHNNTNEKNNETYTTLSSKSNTNINDYTNITTISIESTKSNNTTNTNYNKNYHNSSNIIEAKNMNHHYHSKPYSDNNLNNNMSTHHKQDNKIINSNIVKNNDKIQAYPKVTNPLLNHEKKILGESNKKYDFSLTHSNHSKNQNSFHSKVKNTKLSSHDHRKSHSNLESSSLSRDVNNNYKKKQHKINKYNSLSPVLENEKIKTKHKDTSYLLKALPKLSSRDHSITKIHKSHRNEDISSIRREKYRDITPILSPHVSEGESDFDFSETLITNRKRKRCKSVFDIYFEERKGMLKHSSSLSHFERNDKHSKNNKIHKDNLPISPKDRVIEKDKKKLINNNNNQSFGSKEIQKNDHSSSKYNTISDDDKEKVRKSLEDNQDSEKPKNLKMKKTKVNSKYENDSTLYYYRRQPHRSCRSEISSVNSKYYGMYSSEDNISEIEELFANLDNQHHRSERNNTAEDDKNDYEEISDDHDKYKSHKSTPKIKGIKNSKYDHSLGSLHPTKNKKMKINDFVDKETENADEENFKYNDKDHHHHHLSLDKESKRLKEKMIFKRLKEQKIFKPLSKIKSSDIRNISEIRNPKLSLSSNLDFEDESSHFHDAINETIYENENDYDYKLEDENENDYDYQESDINSDDTSSSTIAITSQKLTAFPDDPKKGHMKIHHSKQYKLKKGYSFFSLSSRHHRTATVTTEESSYMYDDMDSSSEWDDATDKNGRLSHSKKGHSHSKKKYYDTFIKEEDRHDDNDTIEEDESRSSNPTDKSYYYSKRENGIKSNVNTPIKKQKLPISQINQKNSKDIDRNNDINDTNNRSHRPRHLSSNSTSILITTNTLSNNNNNNNHSKKIITKNDCYESDNYNRHSKNHSDTHIIFKPKSQTSTTKSASLKSRILGSSLKKNKSMLPLEKSKVKILDLEEEKDHRFDLFGKKLKSKMESMETIRDDIHKKYKIQSKHKNEKLNEPEIKPLDSDEEEEDHLEEEIEKMIKIEEEKNRKYKRKGEFNDDDDDDDEDLGNNSTIDDDDFDIDIDDDIDIDVDEDIEENSHYDEEENLDNSLFTDNDDSINIETSLKAFHHKKCKIRNNEMGGCLKQPIMVIGNIKNPTLLSRSRSFVDSSNDYDQSNVDPHLLKIKKASQDIQVPIESSTLLKQKMLTRQVIDQLNRLNVTEDEYDITPSLNTHSNIYIKNELFKLLNNIVTKEGLDSHIDNYTTIYSDNTIDSIGLTDYHSKNTEVIDLIKWKEEEPSIHYLCRESSNLSQALPLPSLSVTTTQSMTTPLMDEMSNFPEASTSLSHSSLLQSSTSYTYDPSSILTPDPEKSLEDVEMERFKTCKSDKQESSTAFGSTYLPTPLDSSVEESTKPLSPPMKSYLSLSNSSFETDTSILSIENSGNKGSESFDLKLNETSSISLPFSEEDTPYNYFFAETIKNKIYHTLRTVDLLRDELYQLKFNRLKHEEELIKKNIHPDFEIQQNSLKEELFNRIKFAKKNREASLDCIHKTYQNNVHLINNTFVDNKHKLKLELNHKIGHNYYQLMKEMCSYQRKKVMDKKKINPPFHPKKGILEAATVLATFSTPVLHKEKRNNRYRNHSREMKKQQHHSSTAPTTIPMSSTSSTNLSHSSISTKKKTTESCNGLNSNE